MNWLGAIVSGLVGTVAISLVMGMAPRMGMPRMDIVDMLSTMFDKNGNRTLGWMMHFMMGSIFAVIYALFWSAGIGSPTVITGLIFGGVHWLVVGLVMLGIPMMHAGIRSGMVKPPGAYMTNSGGMMAFVGGLMGHLVFGLVVVLIYGLFV